MEEIINCGHCGVRLDKPVMGEDGVQYCEECYDPIRHEHLKRIKAKVRAKKLEWRQTPVGTEAKTLGGRTFIISGTEREAVATLSSALGETRLGSPSSRSVAMRACEIIHGELVNDAIFNFVELIEP